MALGVNAFDVAPVYGPGGGGETIVGKWLEARTATWDARRSSTAAATAAGSSTAGSSTAEPMGGPLGLPRSAVFLLGKACHPKGGRRRLDRRSLAEDLAGSLRRLRTRFLDVLFLHRDDDAVPVDEVRVVHCERVVSAVRLVDNEEDEL